MSARKPVSRRHFLKVTLAGVSAAGVPLLAACGSSAPAPTTTASTAASAAASTAASAAASTAASPAAAAPGAEITLTTSGWPLNPMPTKEEIEKDKSLQGYAEALQQWMDQHPGVTIKKVETNIWDQQAIVAAISGGTAPTFVNGGAIGNWSTPGAKAAFSQGLMADITPYVDKYGLKQKLIPQMTQAFEQVGYVDGKAYAYPIDAGLAGTIWYRRDLVQAVGGKEPTPDWTWDDMRTLAKALTSEADKRQGLGAPTWMPGYVLRYHGLDLLSEVPAPETGWNWKRDYSDPRFSEVASMYRDMVFKDKSVYTDVALGGGDAEYQKALLNGTIAMSRLGIFAGFAPETQEDSFAALAKRLGKSYSDVWGIAPVPSGDGYRESGISGGGGVSFRPDASPEELDTAISAVDWMFFGKGLDINKAAAYESTKDLKSVFNNAVFITDKTTYEGVPGTFADAWGKPIADQIAAMVKHPPIPDRGLFFPAEQNTGPNSQPNDDAWSKITTEAGELDVAATLQQAADDWNAQASGFNSSVDDATFVDSAKKYYAAWDAYLQANAKPFYDNRFKPWYDSKVKPVLG